MSSYYKKKIRDNNSINHLWKVINEIINRNDKNKKSIT